MATCSSSNNNNNSNITTTVRTAVVPLGELNQEEHPGRMDAGRPPPPPPSPHADHSSNNKADVKEGADVASMA